MNTIKIDMVDTIRGVPGISAGRVGRHLDLGAVDGDDISGVMGKLRLARSRISRIIMNVKSASNEVRVPRAETLITPGPIEYVDERCDAGESFEKTYIINLNPAEND